MNNAADIARKLTTNMILDDRIVVLDLDGFTIALRSNSALLLQRFNHYFAHVRGSGPTDTEVIALDGPADDLGLAFTDWAREPGKTGRKDAYVDLPDGRVVQKIRTGMIFLQSDEHQIAAGPCLEYDNQVINFINTQYMNWLQRKGALICHASGLVIDGHGLGMAGFSGGGKSTLMLQILEHAGTGYLTNDRLFLKSNSSGILALGIPKLPRINPGTIINNSTLRSMLSETRQEQLRALPKAQLWELEEKYDVDVEAVYGKGKIAPTAPLKAFLILNWQRDSAQPCTFSKVTLGERRELLSALMKSPGPFYQFSDGTFLRDDMPLDKLPYLDALQDIDIWEACGSVNFEAATQHCQTIMRCHND